MKKVSITDKIQYVRLAIFIPAFNEEKTIGGVIDTMPKKLSGVHEILLIMVDDGSADKTGEIAKGKNAVVITHAENQGVGKSF